MEKVIVDFSVWSVRDIAEYYRFPRDSYTIISPGAVNAAFTQARGHFQKSVLQNEPWTGSQLRGKAAKYQGKYMLSLWNLRERIKNAGLILTEEVSRRRQVAIETVEEQVTRILSERNYK